MLHKGGKQITNVTLDFGNAEWCYVGHIGCAGSITTTAVVVAHIVAPSVASRAVAAGVSSNDKAL